MLALIESTLLMIPNLTAPWLSTFLQLQCNVSADIDDRSPNAFDLSIDDKTFEGDITY